MDIEFVEYIPTPGEKALGIATISYGTLLLRFRINPGKDGNGFYALPAAHKIGDKYVDSFEIDSRREHAKMIDIVRENVQRLMNPSKYVDNVTTKDFDEVTF